MIWLENPVGVGFSYCTGHMCTAKASNDKQQAADVVSFLRRWYQRYPDMRANALWLTGESYAGHYVPNLALQILTANKLAAKSDRMPLKATFIGNAFTWSTVDEYSAYQFLAQRSFISVEAWRRMSSSCAVPGLGDASTRPGAALATTAANTTMGSVADLKRILLGQRPTGSGSVGVSQTDREQRCQSDMDDVWGELPGSNFNWYNVFADACPQTPDDSNACLGVWVAKYLNDAAVQTALHARSTSWEDCNYDMNGRWSEADLKANLVPKVQQLHALGLPQYYFSGDFDAVVPAHGTARWLADLALPITSPWRPYYTTDTNVGGNVVVYNGTLAFIRVQGGGHMVPTDQGQRMFHVLDQVLAGKVDML